MVQRAESFRVASFQVRNITYRETIVVGAFGNETFEKNQFVLKVGRTFLAIFLKALSGVARSFSTTKWVNKNAI